MGRLFVVIATVGRPNLVRQTVDLLARQTRPADGVLVVGADAEDVAGVAEARTNPEIAFSKRGLCRQRNRALDLLTGRADWIVFFDDDFVPAEDYLEQVERIFETSPEVVGITGELIADGIRSQGYSVGDAQMMLAQARPQPASPLNRREALYGCNMSIRVSAAEGLRFDEALPLYGWQEDIDFTYQLGRRGLLVSGKAITGVHLGTKGGRTAGKKIGYSQVANIVYLWRKGTMQPGLGEKLMWRNLLSNLVRSIRPEPHIDRRGRLHGNIIALRDWTTGKIDPRRIEAM